ncbi:ribulokinase [Flexithrix dorotheae]|uniref:ribulokinase n=1 Tax=Flexithrix dorotheae TaxID=70993 RepID=UPI0003677958|nr:ribulokinase [Flexithrix dorotheae]
MQKAYVIGVDYGTDSVRSIIVDAQNGEEKANSVFYYPQWKEGLYCNPSKNQFRQHPQDYLDGLKETIQNCLEGVSEEVKKAIKGIAIDTTGSTLVAVNEKGTPLALTNGFEKNPNAMFVLWKDHTAAKEAGEINQVARTWGGEDYTKFEGGIYSSEWYWAKILHVIREDESVRKSAKSWVEHCDWIPAVLTGNTNPKSMKRSRCAAGHKAMWHESFDGLPPDEFFKKIDPLLGGIRENLFSETYTSDVPAGNLTKEWAELLGLSEEVVVAVGAYDAHFGAVGGEIASYTLSKVIGTSTCDILIAPMEEMSDKLVKGICGQVDGSVVPGMLGLEAGQSAYGDIYAWFKKLISYPLSVINESSLIDEETKEKLLKEAAGQLIPKLSEEASKIAIEDSQIVAVDWMNGRRTPDANQLLKGAIMGLNLGSDAPGIFKALVEATAFGSKAIVERFLEEGVPIKQVIALGGVAKKSKYGMQVLADVLNMPIKVATSEQTCALGSAMFAAVASGIHATVGEAQKAMGSGFDAVYEPIPANVPKYAALYKEYQKLGKFIEGNTKA